ncbi:MAG: LysM peptidoglycan-binding domain-containing protein [Bacillota bacterium]|nr:LysM peptidoglycan-binding domain-containing protein [Bacillota bacterium]
MNTKKRKRYRVTSKFRFITSIVIMLILATAAFNFITGFHVSTALTKPQYTNVQITYGDTLWALASEYKSNDTDIRRAVFEICRINDIDASQLEPGMTIKIPENL